MDTGKHAIVLDPRRIRMLEFVSRSGHRAVDCGGRRSARRPTHNTCFHWNGAYQLGMQDDGLNGFAGIGKKLLARIFPDGVLRPGIRRRVNFH